jgi:hypothetical protein
MSATTYCFDAEIDAPNGAAAVDLEQRLQHLTPTTVGHGADWIVEVPGPASLDELVVVVRAWLDDLGYPSTTIRADGHVLEIECHRPPVTRSRQFDFIG